VRFTIACLISTFALLHLMGTALADGDAEPRKSEMSATKEAPLLDTVVEEESPTCAADPDPEAVSLEAVARVQQQLREARKAQLELWKQKGWTEKDAAAAGEVVVLSGSGYNYQPTARPLAH